MEVKKIFLIQLGALLCVFNLTNGSVVVETNTGTIAGKQLYSILPNNTYFSFLGIPYAKPPIGKLRFMPPQPHEGWEGILATKKSKKHCAHYNIDFKSTSTHGASGDEDCLYLNVHTPTLPKEDKNPQLPVIVFIHNEYLRATVNVSNEYGPDFFMNEDVVVVTVSFRYGVFGFLSFEDDLLPGNNGLRDIILSLKWVKENIEKFGGDPNNVTLMGYFTGAGLVDILLHSHKAEGLFNRVILQSGTSWDTMYFNQKAKDKAVAFVESVTELKPISSSQLLSFLEDKTANEMVALENRAVHADEPRAVQKGIPAFSPIIEHDHPDAVIKEFPDQATINIDVPIMIGYTSREGIESTDRYLRKPEFLTFADRDFLFIFPVRQNYHFKVDDKMYFDAMQEIKDFYFDEGYIKISRPGEYITYITDVTSVYPMDFVVKKYSNVSRDSVYFYMFDYSGEFNMNKEKTLEEAVVIDGTYGASLGDELCYLFVCKRLRKVYKTALEDEESEDIKVMKNMVRLWTNFAKSGNPTPSDSEFKWKSATPENRECLVISDELQMKSKLHDERIQFWDEFLTKYRDIAVDGVVATIEKDEL